MKRKLTLIAAAALAVIMAFSLVACSGGGKNVTVKFETSSVTMEVDDVKAVNYTVTGSSETPTVKSSKTSVVRAELTTDGKVTLTARTAGTATVTITVGTAKAELKVTVTKADIAVESSIVSVAPGKSDTVKLKYENITVSGNPEVVVSGTGVTATVEDSTAAGATLKFTADASTTLGTSVTVTVKAGGKEAKVDVDVASTGLVYGDGFVNGGAFESGKQGLMVKGLSADFTGTKLVFPRYAKYTSGSETYWAPIMHIGNGLNDRELEDRAHPNFDIGEVELTEVDTGDQAMYVQHMAFQYVNSIRKVRLGKNIQAIGRRSFNNNIYVKDHFVVDEEDPTPQEAKLTFEGTIEELVIDPECKMTILGDDAFHGNNIDEIILPDTVTTIGTGAFRNAGVRVLKLPSRWTELGGEGSRKYAHQFYDCYNLEKIYLPWQCCFSVCDDHYPDVTHDAAYVKDQRAGVLSSIFTDQSFIFNMALPHNLTIYYSGSEDYIKNIMKVNMGGLENKTHDGSEPHGKFDPQYALIIKHIYDNLIANSNLVDTPTTDKNRVTWEFNTEYAPTTKA